MLCWQFCFTHIVKEQNISKRALFETGGLWVKFVLSLSLLFFFFLVCTYSQYCGFSRYCVNSLWGNCLSKYYKILKTSSKWQHYIFNWNLSFHCAQIISFISFILWEFERFFFSVSQALFLFFPSIIFWKKLYIFHIKERLEIYHSLCRLFRYLFSLSWIWTATNWERWVLFFNIYYLPYKLFFSL